MKSATRSARSGRILLVAAVMAVASLAWPAAAAMAGTTATRIGDRDLAAGQIGSRASVPWQDVGPGWTLAVYSGSSGGAGQPIKHGSDTVYLVDPAGGRYTIVTWSKHSAQAQWSLRGWSGDTKRALFTAGASGAGEQVHQLDLKTGTVTSFTLPAHVTVIGYTRPEGLNILAEHGVGQGWGSKQTLVRYNLSGAGQQTLATVRDLGETAYQPSGVQLAAGAQHGLELISNAGGVIRALPVPGVELGCNAVRWWGADTILASCANHQNGEPQMWLVPASGQAPHALTPTRGSSGFDLGDFDAWQLSSGLYVDGLGACGTVVIGRQPAHGAETQVNVPGSVSSLIITATRSWLLVWRINPCRPGGSLVWLNPATSAIKMAVPEHGDQFGVIATAPYFVAGKF